MHAGHYSISAFLFKSLDGKNNSFILEKFSKNKIEFL